MDIPSLPTDNLYKFMALTGLALFGFANYLIFTSAANVSLQTASVRAGLVMVRAEFDAAKDRTERLRELIDNSIAQQKGEFSADDDVLLLRYSDAEIKVLHKEMLQSVDDTQLAAARLQGDSDELGVLASLLIQITVGAVAMIIIGVFAAWYGFHLWYVNVQKPLDLLLQNELEISQARVSSLAGGNSQ